MTIHSYIQDPITHKLIPKDEFYARKEVDAPVIWADLPAYESPIDGRIIEGRSARKADLARTNSRPWEGLEQERKEALRQEKYQQQKRENEVFKNVEQAFMKLPEHIRRQLGA